MKIQPSIIPAWAALIMANDYAIAGNREGWLLFGGIALGLFAWRFIASMRRP